MIQFQQPLEVSDFSGGITDDYIDCKPNQYQKADNYLITSNKKLLSRDGCAIYDSSNSQIPAGNQRIGALINHPSGQLFVQSMRNLYYISGGSFQTLLGPTSNPAFGANTTANFISQAVWRNHVYMTSDSFADPIKVYKDSSDSYRVRNAGLPSVDLEGALDLAVNIRSKYIEHIADTTEHTASADTTNIITSAAPTDLPTLIVFIEEFITDYTAHELDSGQSSGWSYHAGQRTATHALASTAAPTTLAECLTFLDDMKSKFNAHDSDGSAHGADTQHQVSVTRAPSITSGAASATFLYGFFYKYTYTVGDITFETNGPVTLVQTATNLNSGTKTISNLPAISNGGTRNYDTTTITLEIYRSIDGGTTLYKVASLVNGATSYSDTTSDASLVNNELIYTTGGVLDDDTPPSAKYISIVNDHACYAHIRDGNTIYPTRFGLSRPGSPDAYLSSSEDDVEESITGVNNIGIYHILFSKNRVYRLEGFFDELGRGGVEKREISREHGTISNRSIVKIPQGLVFAAKDGFYFTDGYSVNQISGHLNEPYSNLVSTETQQARIYGRYDSKDNLVKWFMSSLSTSTDNDIAWVLDLNFSNLTNPEGDGGVFTTYSNRDSWLASAVEFVDDTWIIGDARGYIFKLDPSALDDLKVDTSVAVSSWNRSAIIWDHKSFCTTFGTSTLYKFTPTITFQAKNLGNVTVQIKSNEEDSNNYAGLKEIRIRDGLTWGESGIEWGESDHLWNVAKLVRAMRRFPMSHMRSIYKQVQVTNSKTNIYNSDTYGTGNTSGAANTLSGISGVFPADVVGYLLTTAQDSYVKEYTITTRNSDTSITVSDPDGDFPTATGTAWLIKGYRKREKLNILSYSFNYAIVAQNQPVYRGDTGANA